MRTSYFEAAPKPIYIAQSSRPRRSRILKATEPGSSDGYAYHGRKCSLTQSE